MFQLWHVKTVGPLKWRVRVCRRGKINGSHIEQQCRYGCVALQVNQTQTVGEVALSGADEKQPPWSTKMKSCWQNTHNNRSLKSASVQHILVTVRQQWRTHWVPRSRTWPPKQGWSTWTARGSHSQRSVGSDWRGSLKSQCKTSWVNTFRTVFSSRENPHSQGTVSLLPQQRHHWPAERTCPAPHSTPRWSAGRWWSR